MEVCINSLPCPAQKKCDAAKKIAKIRAQLDKLEEELKEIKEDQESRKKFRIR